MYSSEQDIQPHLRAMPAYEPVFPFEVRSQQLGLPVQSIIKLDANESPYGSLPAVARVLAEIPYTHIYPDPESRELVESLAAFHHIPTENLMAGAGADELIDLIVRLLVGPRDAIINCPPTFSMYVFSASVNHASVISVPRKADFAIDLDAIEQAVQRYRPKVLFLTSPNNPDGSLLPSGTIDRLTALPLTVVIDEAYVEFAPPGTSRIRKVLEKQNLIVIRTFSKWAGLAGLRVGYGVFPTGLVPHLFKIKQPYNVSVAAAAAAIVSLQNAAQLDENRKKIVAERHRLMAALGDISYLVPYPSHANFILCRVQGRDTSTLVAQLAQRGILVRYYDKPGLDEHIRISVGRPEQTDRLLEELVALE